MFHYNKKPEILFGFLSAFIIIPAQQDLFRLGILTAKNKWPFANHPIPSRNGVFVFRIDQ
jgi:hypothetical protein